MDCQGQMMINHFQKVVDLYPEKRVVIYSSETHQPYPKGFFTGVEFDVENASDNTLFVYHDLEDNLYSWIQNIPMYFRSINSHRGHQFFPNCLGWIRGSIINTHLCIYEFRCFNCGDYKNVRSAAELMRHRDCNVLGTKACQKCGSNGSFAQLNMLFTGNINVTTSSVLNVQRITERLKNIDVLFARINIAVKWTILI